MAWSSVPGVVSTLTPYSDIAIGALYVDPAGSDLAAGTSAGTAFQTIERVCSEVIRLSAFSVEHVVCTMAAGTYELLSTSAIAVFEQCIGNAGSRARLRFNGAARTGVEYTVSSSAGSSEPAGWVLVCGTPGWVADAEVGQMVSVTSGAASGATGIITRQTTTTLHIAPQYVTAYVTAPAAADTIEIMTSTTIIQVPGDGDLLLANTTIQRLMISTPGASGNGRLVLDGASRIADCELQIGGLEIRGRKTVIDHTSILGIGEDDAFRSGLVRVVHGSGVRMGQANLIAPSSLTAGASSYLRIGGEVELLAPLVVRALGATGVHLDGGRISGDETSTLTPAIGFDACTGGLRVDGGYFAAQLWGRGTGADGVTGTYVVEAQRGGKVVMLTGTDLTSAGGAGTGVGDVSADWGVSTANGAADGTYISSSTGGEVVNPLGGWVHIKTVTVGVGGQAAIESGDLSSHTDALAFRWVFSIRSERAVSADALYIAINGDTTDGNYRRQYIQALGTSGSANAAALRNAWNVPAASAASGYYGTGELTINNPRGTTHNKVTYGTSMYAGSGSAIAIRAAYLLYAGDTLAVDDWDLTVQAGSSDIAEGSTASLWKLIA